MRLVVQIPCLNEAGTLPLVLQSIPKSIKGISRIDILVIDDGSTDQTVEVAKKHGVRHFVHHTRTMGLARSFYDGTMRALEMGADIVVNTDGDNQYPQKDIGKLVQPILHGGADIVVADRQISQIQHFSPIKKAMQKLGSRVVNLAAGTSVPDAASGFRAYNRDAIIKLNVITRFSYCLETIIQAGNKRLAIASVPVTTNPKTRESRLFKSTPEHILKSAVAILRAYIMYRPYMFFISLGSIFLVLGAIPFVRYLWFLLHDQSAGHLQSLVIGGTLLTCSLLAYVLGVVADLIRINRILIEDQLTLTKQAHLRSVNQKSDG